MEKWFILLRTALSALSRPADIEEWLSDYGLHRAEFGTLVVAFLCQPPLTFDMLADWTPYTAPGLLRTRLGILQDRGFVQAVNAQECRLTDKGLELIQSWIEKARAHLAGLAPLAARDLRRLSALLARLVKAASAALPPPDKDRLLSSRRIAPAATVVPMVHIDQYLTDMVHFRDDAHVSAWRERGFNGPSIEALTLLWRGSRCGWAQRRSVQTTQLHTRWLCTCRQGPAGAWSGGCVRVSTGRDSRGARPPRRDRGCHRALLHVPLDSAEPGGCTRTARSVETLHAGSWLVIVDGAI